MLLELGHDRGFLASSPRGPFRYNLRFFPFRMPVGAVSPAYLGIFDEFPYWNAAFDLYRNDELAEALQIVEKVGIGIYGDYALPGDIIWIEAATSAESEIVRLGDGLELEAVQEDWANLEELRQVVGAAYTEVNRLIGPLEVDTLITVLKRGIDIPTAQWKQGYFTPKTSYGKICLPRTDDMAMLAHNAKRGLVYQQAFELSAGKADLWLLEAATSILDGTTTTPRNWLDPHELGRALAEEDDSEAALGRCQGARMQAQVIGKRLLERGGVEKLLRCLEEHAEERDRKEGIATSRALKKTYGFDTSTAFREPRSA